MPLTKRLTAEFIGTMWFVLVGCGAAVLATNYPTRGLGFLGVALAFGFAYMSAAYAIGSISGAHYNPAMTLGLVAGKRFPAGEAVPYILAQVLGGVAGAGLLYLIAAGKSGFVLADGMASNGFGAGSFGSPGEYTALAVFVAEMSMTFFLTIVFIGSNRSRAIGGFAPLAIGGAIAAIYAAIIPVSFASLNPARSTGPAVIVAASGGSWAVIQLWMFWLAPILGALLAGFFYLWLSGDDNGAVVVETIEKEVVVVAAEK